MHVGYCERCRYIDLVENVKGICPRCSGNMGPLGIGTAEWNRLGDDEKTALIRRRFPEHASESRGIPEPEYQAGSGYAQPEEPEEEYREEAEPEQPEEAEALDPEEAGLEQAEKADAVDREETGPEQTEDFGEAESAYPEEEPGQPGETEEAEAESPESAGAWYHSNQNQNPAAGTGAPENGTEEPSLRSETEEPSPRSAIPGEYVYVCYKCNTVAVHDGTHEKYFCTECGADMVNVGYTRDAWNGLSKEQKRTVAENAKIMRMFTSIKQDKYEENGDSHTQSIINVVKNPDSGY